LKEKEALIQAKNQEISEKIKNLVKEVGQKVHDFESLAPETPMEEGRTSGPKRNSATNSHNSNS